ncbi:MAG: methyltransferase family protein [Cyclobacteriaceae bacterium]|jgi:protein-S-isoprenylcysteine O-methyltransferase Ste14
MALKKELEVQGNWLFKFRGQLPVVLLLVQFVVYYQAVSGYKLAFEEPLAWGLVCLGISLLGQVIRFSVIAYTPRNTSGRNTKKQVADTVNKTGIYSAVRHPLYLGNFFMWLGIAMITQNLAFVTIFILIFWLFYERIMYAEEQFLSRKFGDEYKEWASRVPAFIPSFSKWVPSNSSFSFKNLLKRETVGIFNLFLVFWLFSLEFNFLRGSSNLTQDPWFWIMIVVGVFTGIIWVIRKSTTWLLVEGR